MFVTTWIKEIYKPTRRTLFFCTLPSKPIDSTLILQAVYVSRPSSGSCLELALTLKKKVVKNLTQADQPRWLFHKSQDSVRLHGWLGHLMPWSLAVIPGNTVSIKEIKYFVFFNAFISVGQSSQRSQKKEKKKIEKLFQRWVSYKAANFNRRHIAFVRTQIATRPPN